MAMEWSESEELYLGELCRLCQELAQKYNVCYIIYKKRQNRVRLPMIALSSISGLISFGTSIFPDGYQSAVNISVGISSMLVALVGSIESFLKIPEIIAGSVQASLNFTKLAESISVELALPRHKRTSSGIVFLRECYKTYEKHCEAAPNVFTHVRFIRPQDKFGGIGGMGGAGAGGMPAGAGVGSPRERRRTTGGLEETTPSTYDGKSLEINVWDTPAMMYQQPSVEVQAVPGGERAMRRSAVDLPV